MNLFKLQPYVLLQQKSSIFFGSYSNFSELGTISLFYSYNYWLPTPYGSNGVGEFLMISIHQCQRCGTGLLSYGPKFTGISPIIPLVRSVVIGIQFFGLPQDDPFHLCISFLLSFRLFFWYFEEDILFSVILLISFHP